jgi:hypothetical protein
MKNDLLSKIQALIKEQKYRLSNHAEIERENDLIAMKEIEEALLSPDSEIIENYPNDPRGHSCLVLGLTQNNKPIHCVCGITLQVLIIITIYRPEPTQWINWRKRKD